MKRNEHKLEPCLREINHHSYVVVYSRTESMDLLTNRLVRSCGHGTQKWQMLFLKSSIIKTIELMLAWSIQQNQM